jgi:hypothetical protein
MYIGLHMKYLFFLSYFNKILIFPTKSSENNQISNVKKIRPGKPSCSTRMNKHGEANIHGEKNNIRLCRKLNPDSQFAREVLHMTRTTLNKRQ